MFVASDVGKQNNAIFMKAARNPIRLITNKIDIPEAIIHQ